ncbi:MAG TPA: hypothetical protein VLH79_12240 [Chthonomonadales bacterium]|nr:hypothetical protein [Chthonomonadales bacterium]
MRRWTPWITTALVVALSAIALRAAAVDEPSAERPRPFRFSLDLYQGISDIEGLRRASDGHWAGSSASWPSTAAVDWTAVSGHGARLAVGVGAAFSRGGLGYRQPAEAWWRVPWGGAASVRAGRFWVPFASQEWLYRPANGLALDWRTGRYEGSGAITLTDDEMRPNVHVRLGREALPGVSAGLSAALGSGASGGPSHTRGIGLDASLERGPWRARGEGVLMWDRGGRSLRFGSVRLGHQIVSWAEPYVALYDWRDDAGDHGRFGGTVYGVHMRASPELAIESAMAATSDRRVYWVQLHLTIDR